MAVYHPECFEVNNPAMCSVACHAEIADYHRIDKNKFDLMTSNGTSVSENLTSSEISQLSKIKDYDDNCAEAFVIGAGGDLVLDYVHNSTTYSVALFKGLLARSPILFVFHKVVAGPDELGKVVIMLTFSNPLTLEYYNFSQAYP